MHLVDSGKNALSVDRRTFFKSAAVGTALAAAGTLLAAPVSAARRSSATANRT